MLLWFKINESYDLSAFKACRGIVSIYMELGLSKYNNNNNTNKNNNNNTYK